MTAEPLARTAPLTAWGDSLGALPDGVQITPRPFVAMTDLRVDPAGPAASVAEYLGVTLPTTPSTYVESETATAIWRPGPVADHQPVPNSRGTGDRAAGGGRAGGTVVDVSA